jgi:hypothetical protein
MWYRTVAGVSQLQKFYEKIEIKQRTCVCGPGSSACIETGYRLDSPGIEYQWGRDIPHLSRPALGPPSLLYNGYRVFPGGKAAGAWS